MQGYIFTKQNAEGVLKAQVAMTRIIKDIALSTSINSSPAPTATSITYTRLDNATNILALDGTNLKINNDILLDKVSAFALSYFDINGATTTTASAIRRVDVSMTSTMADGQTAQFFNSIYIYELF